MADNSNLIADALKKTDPELYAAIDGGNAWRDGVNTRGARVAKYRRYERGDHDANLTTQMRKMLRLKTDSADLEEFNDNYCKIIIDKMAGRTSVSEISTEGETEQQWIDDTLERNEWDALEGEMFRGAVRDGDSYIIIDPLTLAWAGEPAYDGFSGITAIFDDMMRVPLWACKLWSEADSVDLAGEEESDADMRIVVYQPNRVSFWKGSQGGADVQPDNQVLSFGDGTTRLESNEFPWPLGEIPLIHFVNQKDNYTSYGESEIRPAIPLQNVLNRTLHSMVMASELSAFKLYWSKGMAIDKDSIVPGSVINLLVGSAGETSLTAEQIEFLKAVEVGEFNETDISNYTQQIDKVVREISQATQTPIYGVTAQGNVSGEALRQLEIGLIGKVKRFQRENNGAIRDLIILTSEVQNAFSGLENGLGTAPTIETVSVNWKTAEIIDVEAQMRALFEMREKAPGLWPDDWYRQQIGGLLAMTQKQIKEEGENAQNAQSLFIDSLIGAGGGAPVV